MPAPLVVTLRFSRSCPSHAEAAELVTGAAAEAGVAIDLRPVEVTSDAQAEALRFPGSPTFLAGGEDLFPLEGPVHAYQHDACRAFVRADGRIGPLPDRAQVIAALRAAGRRAA